MEILKNCPSCNKSIFKDYMTIKDYFLSKEIFNLVECDYCGLVFLNPRPKKDELFKYYDSNEYISHEAHKRTILSKIYYRIREYSVKKKYQQIMQYTNGNSILDIGCGTGELLTFFDKKGWHTTGIEPNDKARNHCTTVNNLSVFKETEIRNLESLQYDVITMYHVLEHVYDLHDRMSEINRLLKKNGLIVLALPNISSYDAKYYKEKWAAYDVPRHVYHFNKLSLTRLLDTHNMQIIRVIPMVFDAYYISIISEKYRKSGVYGFVRALVTGMISNSKASGKELNFSSLTYMIRKKQN